MSTAHKDKTKSTPVHGFMQSWIEFIPLCGWCGGVFSWITWLPGLITLTLLQQWSLSVQEHRAKLTEAASAPRPAVPIHEGKKKRDWLLNLFSLTQAAAHLKYPSSVSLSFNSAALLTQQGGETSSFSCPSFTLRRTFQHSPSPSSDTPAQHVTFPTVAQQLTSWNKSFITSTACQSGLYFSAADPSLWGSAVSPTPTSTGARHAFLINPHVRERGGGHSSQLYRSDVIIVSLSSSGSICPQQESVHCDFSTLSRILIHIMLVQSLSHPERGKSKRKTNW